MASNQKFTTSSLNQLISDSVAEADQFKTQLQTINSSTADLNFIDDTSNDDYLPEEDKTFAEKKDAINPNSGDSISYTYIYRKIGDLADAGNTSLQMLQSIDPDMTDPKILVAVGSLINSIRACLAEYTKIHQQWIKFKQILELEKIKQANKKEIIEYRKAVSTGQLNKETAQNELFELTSTDLVEFLQWKKEKELAEQEKREKI